MFQIVLSIAVLSMANEVQLFKIQSPIENYDDLRAASEMPTSPPETRFVDVCTKFTKNQKVFAGECNLYPPNVFDSELQLYLEVVRDCDSRLSIDKLIREKFSVFDWTGFFRANYSSETVYIDKLNGKKRLRFF